MTLKTAGALGRDDDQVLFVVEIILSCCRELYKSIMEGGEWWQRWMYQKQIWKVFEANALLFRHGKSINYCWIEYSCCLLFLHSSSANNRSGLQFLAGMVKKEIKHFHTKLAPAAWWKASGAAQAQQYVTAHGIMGMFHSTSQASHWPIVAIEDNTKSL